MKNFYLKFAASYVLLVAALTGCAALSEHSAAVALIVGQATGRYIESYPRERRAEVAARVTRIASDIEAVASGKPVTIAELAALAVAAIPSNLEPSDRALAMAIIQVAAQELQNKIGENVLTPEQTVTVKEVVEAVKLAASSYIPRTTP